MSAYPSSIKFYSNYIPWNDVLTINFYVWVVSNTDTSSPLKIRFFVQGWVSASCCIEIIDHESSTFSYKLSLFSFMYMFVRRLSSVRFALTYPTRSSSSEESDGGSDNFFTEIFTMQFIAENSVCYLSLDAQRGVFAWFADLNGNAILRASGVFAEYRGFPSRKVLLGFYFCVNKNAFTFNFASKILSLF